MGKEGKRPIVVLIGGGSRLPAIFEYVQNEDSPAYISLVVSHKKESPGIGLALKHQIPAVFWNFVQWKAKTKRERSEYMEALGYFVSQTYYRPDLVVAAGWDLILTPEFLQFFKRDDGYYNAINLHPAPLPYEVGAKTVKLADGTEIPVIKGEINEVLPQVLKLGVPIWGSTIHFITPNVDEGPIILRSEVPVLPDDDTETLKERLQSEEDKILPQAIDLFARDRLKIENGKVKIFP